MLYEVITLAEVAPPRCAGVGRLCLASGDDLVDRASVGLFRRTEHDVFHHAACNA